MDVVNFPLLLLLLLLEGVTVTTCANGTYDAMPIGGKMGQCALSRLGTLLYLGLAYINKHIYDCTGG